MRIDTQQGLRPTAAVSDKDLEARFRALKGEEGGPAGGTTTTTAAAVPSTSTTAIEGGAGFGLSGGPGDENMEIEALLAQMRWVPFSILCLSLCLCDCADDQHGGGCGTTLVTDSLRPIEPPPPPHTHTIPNTNQR
jgi:hypothetical protein